MIRKSFLLLTLSSFVLMLSASDYQYINQQLKLLKIDPIQALTMVKNRIDSRQISLSQEECILLTHRLTKLKKLLCSRPSDTTLSLTLPALAVIFFGARLAYYWYDLVPFKDSSMQSLALEGIRHNAEYFWMSLVATILLNIEYKQKVADLFEKERVIESKINSLIAALNNGEFYT